MRRLVVSRSLVFLKLLCQNEATFMAIGIVWQTGIISHREIEDMFTYPTGELLDWPIITIRDERSDLHSDKPFPFTYRMKCRQVLL